MANRLARVKNHTGLDSSARPLGKNVAAVTSSSQHNRFMAAINSCAATVEPLGVLRALKMASL